MAANVRMNANIRRRWVTGDLLSERRNAAELRAFTTRDVVLREHRRIAADLADDEVQVGLEQNRVTTVGRALSGIGSAVGYCGLGLLLYGGALPLDTRIRLIDKGQHGSHGEFEYSVPNARPDFLTGQYPVKGTVAAYMCGQCGRVTLYGQPKDG